MRSSYLPSPTSLPLPHARTLRSLLKDGIGEDQAKLELKLGAGVGTGHELAIEHAASGTQLPQRAAVDVSFAPPSIDSFEVLYAVTEGPKADWTLTLRLEGRNFGASQGDSGIAVGGEPCGPPSSDRWSHHAIECVVNAVASASDRARTVVMVVAGQSTTADKALDWECAPGCRYVFPPFWHYSYPSLCRAGH